MHKVLRKFITETLQGAQLRIDDYRSSESGLIDGDSLKAAGYGYLGEGAYRTVYHIPDHDDKVLKIAQSAPDCKVNKHEANKKLQAEYPEFIPQIYGAADDYAWIIVERVRPIGDREFDHVLRVIYPAIDEIPSSHKRRIYPHHLVQNLLEPPKPKSYVTSIFRELNEIDPNILGNIRKQITRLETMVNDYFIIPSDIKGGNVGVRTASATDGFVLLDVSIFKDTGYLPGRSYNA